MRDKSAAPAGAPADKIADELADKPAGEPAPASAAAPSSAHIAAAKSALRARLKAERAALDPCERARADEAIAANVLALPAWDAARVVFTYLSFGAEVQTHDLIRKAWAQNKVVALPYCVPNTRRMRWYRVSDLDHLRCSAFGVEEPVPDSANEINPNSADALALVPGLSFDAHGYRIGYGGGFYDAFLADFAGASVGLCRAAHLTDDLRELGVVDAHDLPVHLVATERAVLDSRA